MTRHHLAGVAAWAAVLCGAFAVAQTPPLLLNPDAPEFQQRAPSRFHVRLETGKGLILLDVERRLAPNGVDRFYNLVRHGYYDDARFFRVIAGRFAQVGIHSDPAIAQAWRSRTIPDDPRVASNVRGSLAFAFAEANGRTTQIFINLRDNTEAYDKEPFVPFAHVIDGMDVAGSLFAEYGETAGGGIRAGRQDPLFTGGNLYLKERFPKLDYITRALIDELGR